MARDGALQAETVFREDTVTHKGRWNEGTMDGMGSMSHHYTKVDYPRANCQTE